MGDQRDVLIIGGGVIGMASAAELAGRGARVTVIDKGLIGYGCSYGNAGWLTPCFALPLPMPGMFFKSIKWLLDPGSPLYIKPAFSWLLARWLARFLLSMNERHLQRSVEVLTAISKYSLEAYEQLGAGQAIGFERRGLLMVGQTKAGSDAAVHELELVQAHGVPGRFMNEDELRAFEPALTGRLAGGVYFPNEAHAEPLAIVRALADKARAAGARILERTEVYDFEVSDRRVTGLRTTHGLLQAEQYVLATGSWSQRLGRMLRLRVPILGGKGYAIIVPPFGPAPERPLMLIEKKIAVTPRAGTVRLAGTLELVNQDLSITRRRVDAIVSGAREFLNVPAEPAMVELWRGLRPCTPDGVPIIGRSPHHDNLVLATGHQMLGLQSAPGTGRLVGDIVTGAPPAFPLEPFSASRF